MRLILSAAAFLALSGLLSAQGPPAEVVVKGKVLDAEGRPVEGAALRAHALDYEQGRESVRPLGETTSAADGSFSFRAAGVQRVEVCARKEGLALGFDGWFHLRPDRELEIRMIKPAAFSGTVVDDAGAPVAGADLWVTLTLRTEKRYSCIEGLPPLDWLRARSDAQGRFTFSDLPDGASVTLRVDAPGRARIYVQDDTRATRCVVGMTDLRIVTPPSARIEGSVVEKGTRRPVAGVALSLQSAGAWVAEPCVSRPDGSFSADRLPPGQCTVALVVSGSETEEWVADYVEAKVEAGKPAPQVAVEVSKGGIVEVCVTDARTERPVAGAYVAVERPGSPTRHFSGKSGADGVARIRVLPGSYFGGLASATGYDRTDLRVQRLDMADGGTGRVDVKLTPLLKVRGTARDEAGRAVEGVSVSFAPGYGTAQQQTKGDGAFEAAQGQSYGGGGSEAPFILARHVDRNLAALVEAPQDEKPLDLKLVPGCVIFGRVVDPQGKPIPGAKVSAAMRFERSSAEVADRLAVDAGGGYEVKALPAGEDYVIYGGAEGYGNADLTVSLAATGDRRCKAEDMVLRPATLSVSGVVSGEDGKPATGVRVNVYGQGQPYRPEVAADADGKFTVTGLCEGSVYVSAGSVKPQRYGRLQARAGDKDLKVVVRERTVLPERTPAPEPPSLAGKPLPETLGLTALKGRMRVLVCFFDPNGRPSRHACQALLARAGELAGKDVVFVPIPLDPGAPGDEKKRFDWGVRGWPWLILTDRAHVVRAEGFTAEDLDAKLGGLREKE